MPSLLILLPLGLGKSHVTCILQAYTHVGTYACDLQAYRDTAYSSDMKSDPKTYRSECPLAASLDLIGDKWSLVIARDMMVKKKRYRDFESSPEGIPTNILANRLRRLEEDGIIAKTPYQRNPLRYEYFLTPKGADLLPVLQQLALWGHKHIPGRWAPPAWFLEAKPADLLKKK